MLLFTYADDLARRNPALALEMFRHRTIQFRDRLGWPVNVGADGDERDAYDTMNPLYVIWVTAEGRHGGSARFLPTTGDHMAADHFSHLTGGGAIRSPSIWECTRFCLAPGAEGRIGSALMLGGAELMAQFGLTHLLGVFDHPDAARLQDHGLGPRGAGPMARSASASGTRTPPTGGACCPAPVSTRLRSAAGPTPPSAPPTPRSWRSPPERPSGPPGRPLGSAPWRPSPPSPSRTTRPRPGIASPRRCRSRASTSPMGRSAKHRPGPRASWPSSARPGRARRCCWLA